MKQPNKIYLSDLMSDADKAKMKAFRLSNEKKQSDIITHEWLAICEFGFYYGWEAIKAFNNDEVSIEQMYRYIDGARKLHSRHVYDNLVSAGASKYGGIDFGKEMNQHITNMKEVN